MAKTVTPMIHVPDVRAAVDWYRQIGFDVTHTYDDSGDGLSFAILTLGASQVMFNSGGRPAAQRRREVDLYISVENVRDFSTRLSGRVEVVKEIHETFYGMREFIIRDLNGFWITFGRDCST
jgi:uncharacterized glyoxalase superfamily protein PhnB